MGVLILSNAKNKHIPYGEWLSFLKEELFLICDNEYNATHTKFTEIKKFSQYEDNEKLMEYARSIITEYKIKTILGKSECDILRCAQLRDEFILHGQSYSQALPYRNKVVMKNILQSQNISVAHFCEPKSLNDAKSFAEIHGFPLILKPEDGSGSLNTLKLNTPSDLFQVSSFANTILEEFIDGKMYHVDGLYLNHELIFASPSVYETGCLEFQNKKSLKSHTLHIDNKLFTRLIDFTQRVIKALPSHKNMAFHAEIFHTQDDKLILCEIASRSGGGKIRQVIEHSYGINIDKYWIQSQCGIETYKETKFPKEAHILAGFILIPPKNGMIKKFASHNLPNWVVEYNITGKIGQYYSAAQKSTDNIASFVVEGATEEVVKQRLNDIENWFNNGSEWVCDMN